MPRESQQVHTLQDAYQGRRVLFSCISQSTTSIFFSAIGLLQIYSVLYAQSWNTQLEGPLYSGKQSTDMHIGLQGEV